MLGTGRPAWERLPAMLARASWKPLWPSVLYGWLPWGTVGEPPEENGTSVLVLALLCFSKSIPGSMGEVSIITPTLPNLNGCFKYLLRQSMGSTFKRIKFYSYYVFSSSRWFCLFKVKCVCVRERERKERGHIHEYVCIPLVKVYEGEVRKVTDYRNS